METIKMSDILGLYNKCGIQDNDNGVMRKTINTGSLNNKLNANFDFMNKNSIKTILSNNTVELKK